MKSHLLEDLREHGVRDLPVGELWSDGMKRCAIQMR